MKRFLLAVLAAAGALIAAQSFAPTAEAQQPSTVSNYVVNGWTACTSTRTRVAPTSVSTRSYQTTNAATTRCFFGSATVTTANGQALCSSYPTCPGTTQSWATGNANTEWMIAPVGSSMTVTWNGAGF